MDRVKELVTKTPAHHWTGVVPLWTGVDRLCSRRLLPLDKPQVEVAEQANVAEQVPGVEVEIRVHALILPETGLLDEVLKRDGTALEQIDKRIRALIAEGKRVFGRDDDELPSVPRLS